MKYFKFTGFAAALVLCGCSLVKQATPLGVADALAEQAEAAARENTAETEKDITTTEIEEAKAVFDAFKDCVAEFRVDMQIPANRACSACAERYNVSKGVCIDMGK